MSRFSHESIQDKSINGYPNFQTPEIIVTYGKFDDIHPGVPIKGTSCNFCKNNKEAFEFYSNHTVRTCPIIRSCRCSICGETGHTMGHCTKNPSKLSVTRLIGMFNNKGTN